MVPGPRSQGAWCGDPPRIAHLCPPPSCQSGAGRGQADTLSLEMVDGVVTVTYCHAVSRSVTQGCKHRRVSGLRSHARFSMQSTDWGEGAEVVLGGPATAEEGIKTEQKYEANEVPSPAAPPGLNLHYHSSALLGGRPSKYFLIATSGCSNERAMEMGT